MVRRMTNSMFFNEATIVANSAMKYGIATAIKQLKAKRKSQAKDFDDKVFETYAKSYAKIAAVLIAEYDELNKEITNA